MLTILTQINTRLGFIHVSFSDLRPCHQEIHELKLPPVTIFRHFVFANCPQVTRNTADEPAMFCDPGSQLLVQDFEVETLSAYKI